MQGDRRRCLKAVSLVETGRPFFEGRLDPLLGYAMPI